MKKLLLSVLIILIGILIGITVVNGIHIGNLDVLGIVKIKAQDEELDKIVEKSNQMVCTEYPKKMSELQDNIKNLNDEKDKYEEYESTMTPNEIKASLQPDQSALDFLYVKIGNHAKSEGVTLNMDIKSSIKNSITYYNISFNVKGTYLGVAEFIRSIEDDSCFGFKIENFKMIRHDKTGSDEDTQDTILKSLNNGEIVEATFECKNIKIGNINDKSTTGNQSNDSQSNDKKENTTNTLNTTN